MTKALGTLLPVLTLLFALCVAPRAAQAQAHPRRVAVISSSGVDNDFRSFHEYDGCLANLRWPYDKFRNTELSSFFEKADEYDLVLTTSLWNYGDPQDLVGMIPRWKAYLSRGGVVILTDMAYAPMCDWLGAWDPGLAIEYADATRDLGSAQAALDVAQPSTFLSTPNPIKVLFYWAHFCRFGERYKVWAQTKAGTAIGLVAQVERGSLIVTTAWALSPDALLNVYTNALAVRTGFLATLTIPEEMPPGIVRANVQLESLRDEVLQTETQIDVQTPEGAILQASPWVAVSLPPLGRQEVGVEVPCEARGNFRVVVNCRGPDWHQEAMAVRILKVPALVEVHLPRTIFLRTDEVSFAVRVAPRIGEEARVTIEVAPASGRPTIQRTISARSLQQPNIVLGQLPVGAYEVSAAAETDGGARDERGEAKASFEVVDLDRPAMVTAVGQNGEVLLNGEPVFLLGSYHVGTEDLATIKELGFNCVTGPIYGGEQSEITAGQLSWHDEAYRRGLGVITELSEFIRGGRRNYGQVKALVSRLRVHPATIAHYTIDEPAGGGISPEDVQRHVNVVREADPEHVTIVVEVPGQATTYANLADLTGVDPYPIGAAAPASLAGVGAAIRELVSASLGRPVLGVIQAHRQPPPNSANRYPTPEELRCMAYLALNNGAKGLLFYAWGDMYETETGQWPSGFAYSQELRQAFKQLNAELSQMGLRYVEGRLHRDGITVSPPDSPIDAAWVEEPGRKTLVCVNPTKETLQVALTWPAGEVIRAFAPFEVYIDQR
ncbi:MAG: hypothetical protein N2512_11270 [Armatimonadetes bacterium]|nr:hypothetical protein [Armatimonadota bacterium]